MRSRAGRRAAVATVQHLCIALALLVSFAPPVSAQQDTTAVDALVELRVQDGPPTQVIPALVRDTTLLLPFGQLLELFELRTTGIEPGRRWQALLAPSEIELDVRTRDAVARRDTAQLRFARVQSAWRDGMLYLSAPVVEWLLDVRVGIDWPELTVVVRHTDHLPVVQRLARERRRERLLAERRRYAPRLDLSQRSRAADGAVLDWAFTTSSRDPLSATGVDLGLGLQVAGGSFIARHAERATSMGRYAATEAEWTKAWSDNPWYRQAGLGYVTAAGPDPRRVLGFTLTNAPFVRPSLFADERLDGYLPPGWEVEVYQGERLVAFTRVDQGSYGIDVPIRYGPNPLTVVAYGPNGERFESRRSVVVPFDRIPGGSLEYAVSAGACRTDPCRWSASADLAYGALHRLTLRAGTQLFERDSLPDLAHPYAAVTASPHPSLNLSARWTGNAYVAGGIEYRPSPDFEAALRHVEYLGAVEVPLLGSATLDRRLSGFLFWRPGRRDRAPFVRVDLQHMSGPDLRRDYARVGGTGWVGSGRVEIGASVYGDRSLAVQRPAQFVVDAAAGSVVGSLAPSLGATYVRGELAASPDSGLVRAFARVAQPISGRVRLDLGVGWQAGTGFRLELDLTSALDAFRAVSRNRYTSSDGMDGLQLMEGSVIWDRHGDRLQVADGRSVGRSGISGVVFLDADGDGHQGEDEPGEPGLRLRVGSQSAETDSLGRFTAWDLLPFEQVEVAVDSLSLRNPLWLPADPAVSLAVGPNSYGYLEVPLVMAGEVSGSVVWTRSGRPVPGTEIEVVATETGAVHTIRTFSDGQFYLFGLRPGSYELRVSEESRKRLQALAEVVRFEVGLDESTRAVEGIELRVGIRPNN